MKDRQKKGRTRVPRRSSSRATTQTNFRLTAIAKTLLKKIARSLGLSSAAALEIVIREAAEKRRIE